MNDGVLQWGILSTARINRALIPPLKASSRNQLLAVGSRDRQTAEKYAREQGIPKAYETYEALLADPDIDVIYNPLPNHLHAEWSIKAMQAGKHVLCEKPMAITMAEMQRLEKAAVSTGRVLAEAFMYRHHPQTLRVQEIVASGALGRLQLIRGAFTFPLKRENDIRRRADTGGGSIWDVGCYPISYARMIAGAEPEEVFGWEVPGAGGVDESFVGQMRFPGEVFATFDCGFSSPQRTDIEIVGSEAMLQVPMAFKPQTDEEILISHGEAEQREKIRGKELYIGEVEDMADAVLNGAVPRISLDDSRGNLATILGLLESARTGKPVTLKSSQVSRKQEI
jgi:xylose dehydrogenase (NAD/NADP)